MSTQAASTAYPGDIGSRPDVFNKKRPYVLYCRSDDFDRRPKQHRQDKKGADVGLQKFNIVAVHAARLGMGLWSLVSS